LADIAAITGGRLVTEELGLKLEQAELEVLGHAGKVISTKDSTTIVDGKGDKETIASRVEKIKKEKELATSDYDKTKLQERLAKLAGGVAVIKVGAATETEMKEKKYRIEDALNATRAAIEEGVVPGGGLALAMACYGHDFAAFEDKVNNQDKLSMGEVIVNQSVLAPLKQIANNAGVDGSLILQRTMTENKDSQVARGYNAATGEYVNMIESGIIDPVKVVRLALENAVSAAIMFLSTEAVITDKKEEEKDSGSDHYHGYDGMM
jgi:chaperonin GroEL